MAIGLLSSTRRGRRLDAAAFRVLNADRGRGVDLVFEGITELGSIWGSAGAAAAIARAGRKDVAGRAFGAAGAAWVLGQALKKAFRRPRPYDAHLAGSRLLIGRPQGTSWPSSHPMVLLAFSTVAARGLRLRRGVDAGVLALAGAVGLSRSSLGVHFPSDVAGGLLLGRALGLVVGRRGQAPSHALPRR